MWYAWVIILIAILSILISIIIIPLFGAWYSASIILLIAGIAIIIIGSLWLANIPILPTLGLNPRQERAAAISSIVFGVLLVIFAGILFFYYRYFYLGYVRYQYHSKDFCREVLTNPSSDPISIIYQDCVKQYPKILEETPIIYGQARVETLKRKEELMKEESIEGRMVAYTECKKDCQLRYPGPEKTLERGQCIQNCGKA